jgi:hypothetical protein
MSDANQHPPISCKITNFRGAASAEFSIDNITLIGGPNAAGKSSIAQAVGAALTGEPLPIRGLKASQAGVLVRGGTAAGQVAMCGPSGMVTIDYPKGKVATEGRPPFASPFAAGLRTVIELPVKERSEILSKYLKSEPTRQDLEAAISDLDLAPEHLEKLWNAVQQQGWDGAHAAAKEKGAKLKGQWEDITAERYGSKKAETWLPGEWEPDLDGSSEDDLKARVTDARDALEAAIAAQAVDSSKLADLEALWARLPELRRHAEEAAQVRDNVTAVVAGHRETLQELKPKPELLDQVEAARKAVQAVPPATKGSTLACPHCHGSVSMLDGRLIPAAAQISDEEVERLKQQMLDAQFKLGEAERAMKSELEARRGQAITRLEDAEKDLAKAAEAAAGKASELARAEAADRELAERREQPQGDVQDVDVCRNELARAEARLKAWQRKSQADNRHASIVANQFIADALAPEGVRLKKLEKSIGEFNRCLALICASAGWGTVTMDRELEASLNGTPYYLLSESEKWRARVSLQLAMAGLDGSEAVVIDGADILVDRQLRNGLFRSLELHNALVCMAMRGPDELPDLDGHEMGHAYWMGPGGHLVSRSQALAG